MADVLLGHGSAPLERGELARATLGCMSQYANSTHAELWLRAKAEAGALQQSADVQGLVLAKKPTTHWQRQQIRGAVTLGLTARWPSCWKRWPTRSITARTWKVIRRDDGGAAGEPRCGPAAAGPGEGAVLADQHPGVAADAGHGGYQRLRTGRTAPAARAGTVAVWRAADDLQDVRWVGAGARSETADARRPSGGMNPPTVRSGAASTSGCCSV